MNSKKTSVQPKDAVMIAFVFMMLFILFVIPVTAAPPAPAPVLLDPKAIPKYENQITGPPPVYVPVSPNYYEVNVTNFTQRILPQSMGVMTPVWGYGGMTALGYVRNSPGPTFEITRGTPVTVKWINELTGEHMFAVDPTFHWANPNNLSNEQPMPGMFMFNCSLTPTGTCTPFPPGYAEAQRMSQLSRMCMEQKSSQPLMAIRTPGSPLTILRGWHTIQKWET